MATTGKLSCPHSELTMIYNVIAMLLAVALTITRADAQGACAQTCMRQGTAGAPCDSITDRNCICGGGAIAVCVQNNCTSPEQKAFSSLSSSVCSLFTTVGGGTSGTIPTLSIPVSLPTFSLPTASLPPFSPPLSSVTTNPTSTTSSGASSGLSQASSASSSAVSSPSSVPSSATSGSSSAASSSTSGAPSQTSNAATKTGKVGVNSGVGSVVGVVVMIVGIALGGAEGF
ncbi:hypothetical protein C8T65DRAFT_669761 [Cerioporus squamosus]|nr:hypothetical protein C8T65DRAFT_669761 [Cerioporus squamosus]